MYQQCENYENELQINKYLKKKHNSGLTSEVSKNYFYKEDFFLIIYDVGKMYQYAKNENSFLTKNKYAYLFNIHYTIIITAICL